MIVVDSNVLAARLLQSENLPLARQLEATDPVWVAPPLWRYEFKNILTKIMWAGLTTPAEALKTWMAAFELMASNEHDPSPARVLDLSARQRISAYDATFVALAMELGAPCLTQDAELRRKFPGVAFSLADYLRKPSGDGKVREKQEVYRVRRTRRAR